MFDANLISTARFAVAFSGGSDSTALLHMLREHNPLVLIVDHGLRDGSRQEAEQAREVAANLGLDTHILTWQNDHPSTGIQEKARNARYGLMGQACRKAGIKYLLTGHTQDDQAETLLMRYDRNTGWRGAAGTAKAVYAPLWPELANVTVVRPLLSASRSDLRDYNRQHNLTWAEDPSNRNTAFTRIRARSYLANRPKLRRHLLHSAEHLHRGLEAEKMRLKAIIHAHGRVDKMGLIYFDCVPPKHLLRKSLQVTSGQSASIDGEALSQLHKSMQSDGFSPQTLGGAYISKRKNTFIIGRDPVAAKGRANQSAITTQNLRAGHSLIWDGRFRVTAQSDVTLMTRYAAQGGKKAARKTGLSVLEMSQPVCIKGDCKIESLVASRLQNMLKSDAELIL